MCGIAGIISPGNKEVHQARLQLMTDSIRHRGPDGEGFWINEQGTVAFGHRRLSIIDLSEAASQPMHFLDRFTITYNGEIYNYIELKSELEKKGYRFHSHSDTEVILAAYTHYGIDCLQHFDGMFAFAIWDSRDEVLFCARDRFGEKPFYYSYANGELLFASEMKALWAAGVEKKMDPTMLLNYLTIGATNYPLDRHQTFFSNISSLPPAHYLLYHTINNEINIDIKPYWDIDKVNSHPNISEADAIEKFTALLTTSVKRRLRSDVTIGSSLSGGLDSSAIVAIINQQLNQSVRQKTFSATFPGFEKDESAYIKQVVAAFKIDNFTTTPSSDDFITDLQKLIYHQEEPFQSASIYAQYKVYELAKQQHVTVILDGQGADETLAGYTKYYHWYWQELIAKRKFKDLKKERNAAIKNGQTINWSFKNYLAAWMPQVAANQLEKKTFRQVAFSRDFNRDFVEENKKRFAIYKPAIYNLNDILYFNTMQSGLEELLRYSDRNSMAHSREVRLPFLSHELVQFIFSLPSSYKIKNGFTKNLLRLSMQDHLPASIVWRKDKVGYEPPQKLWMQNEKMKDCIHESRKKLVAQSILNKKVLDRPIILKDAHESGNLDWRYLCAAQCL